MEHRDERRILRIYFEMNEKWLDEAEIKLIWNNVIKKIRVKSVNSFFFEVGERFDLSGNSFIKFSGIYLN